MMHFLSGDVYYGYWTADERTGYGVLYLANGNIFSGIFFKGKREGG